jgi:hypothetical protein
MNVYRGILRGATAACLLAAASFAADANHSPLTVQASATEVHLHWFEHTPVVVERKAPDGEFQVLGIAPDGEFTDRAIDRHQIYTYRATPIHGLAPKIAVTVGPPPAGFSTVVANPNQNSKFPENFGQYPCFVLDQNGDPLLSYVWVNPSGNGSLNNSDTALYFVSWNRSSNSFNAPVEIAVTGDVSANQVETASNYPEALARDPVNNTLAIAYRSYSANAATAYVNIAFSTDGGQTWASQVVTSAAVAVNDYSNLALALYNGAVYLIYYVGSSGPAELVTGTETTAPNTWSSQHFPQVTGYSEVLNYYSIALDSSGVPAVVLTRQPNGSGAYPTYFWRPIANTLVQVLTDNGDGSESYSAASDYAVQLVFHGTAPYILYGGARTASPNPNFYEWVAYSTTGAAGTWTITNVPANGPVANGDTIQEPFGISVGSAGQVTVASTSLGNYGTGNCGVTPNYGVELAQTTNLSTWSVCALGGASGANFHSVQPVVHYGVNDALFVAFDDPTKGDALPNGVNLWANYPNGTCSYSVTANALGIDNAAGSYSFILNAPAGCSWVEDASNTPSWLTITPPAFGSGTATISFSAAANTAGTARVGTLTVAGIPFTITQSACSFGPAASSASVADVQTLINEALGTQSPTNDLNKDGVVNVVDIQIEILATLGMGCAAS